MNKENLNVQEQNPEQVIEQKIYNQTKSKISESTKTGLIISLIGSAIFIIIGLSVIISLSAKYAELILIPPDGYKDYLIWKYRIIILVMVSLFLAVPAISIVISTVALKNQNNILVTIAGVLGILYGIFLGGILILNGKDQK